MVARQFLLCHHGEEFPIEYDSDDGIEVLKFQIFSLTSVVPDDQKILEEGCEVEVTEESDLKTISEKLRLVSFHDDIKGKETADSKTSERSDEELARMIQAEEDAIAMQMFQDSGASGRRMFEQRLRPCISQVLMYEDSKRKEAARKSVPIDRIEEKALVSLGKEGNLDPSKEEKDHAFLLQLLYWFKQSFSWVNSPPCENCGSETTFIGMGSPLPSETYFSCSSVELFRCQKHCSKNSTRFPRYNDPLKLLETRRGRCGEWANCFTLYCRAFNYESRFILDFTDHVWTECFSHLHGRWMHLDPCEGVYDNPLLYEKGLLPLYFPRDKHEEEVALSKLPADVGDENGETIIDERKIRIKSLPIVPMTPTKPSTVDVEFPVNRTRLLSQKQNSITGGGFQ
ncbi:Peptide-N(4)-(N-acetyl-beta-glucosaminyl)asparagine amidase [Zostera marina]|uniref:Peptide-N(4)-(N-acetyl-beta-glucosaminyl)asparagine amidase n=1 Tax=Zostera marina TaxID=29655 RepID=A0A0K9NTD1_ZOSMR|nr:Peptide-N(4)-(N-acetyl-beta-glucosaminyl)asparagine amidase [Zostera marina]